jgi:hypothetical protein
MGIHWYARSKESMDVMQRLDEVERRIFRPDADKQAIEAALTEREALYVGEDEARAELKHRGYAVTIGSTRQWPSHVSRHVDALGPAEPDPSFLDLLGWGTDYYIENLRDARVPMDKFSHHLDYLRLSPQQACALGEELLRYASHERRENRVRRAREAGLWLYLWGSVDCHVEAGQ